MGLSNTIQTWINPRRRSTIVRLTPDLQAVIRTNADGTTNIRYIYDLRKITAESFPIYRQNQKEL
jgi:hypothetical protein